VANLRVAAHEVVRGLASGGGEVHDLAGAIAKAVNAGVDMSMQVFGADQWQAAIVQDVATGAISHARIDQAVRRILTLKFHLGLFDQPCIKDPNTDCVDAGAANAAVTAGRQATMQAARDSITLLRNQGDVLPLSPTGKVVRRSIIQRWLRHHGDELRLHQQLPLHRRSATRRHSRGAEVAGGLRGAPRSLIDSPLATLPRALPAASCVRAGLWVVAATCEPGPRVLKAGVVSQTAATRTLLAIHPRDHGQFEPVPLGADCCRRQAHTRGVSSLRSIAKEAAVWMNIEEIAEYAGVSPALVRAAIAHRALHGVTTDPNNPDNWMIRQTEVDRWVATLPKYNS
jgi:hypothetical protein